MFKIILSALVFVGASAFAADPAPSTAPAGSPPAMDAPKGAPQETPPAATDSKMNKKGKMKKMKKKDGA